VSVLPRTDGRNELVILDVDGTLIDSNYQHVLAWVEAFRARGHLIPAWSIHRHVGMGGDQLIEAVAGAEVEEADGDVIRDAHDAVYVEHHLADVRPFDDAVEFLRRLRAERRRVVLASSANERELDRYRELLDADGLTDGATSAGDVDRTKPAPDLVRAARDLGGGGQAVMVGDSVWDCVAAEPLSIPVVGVLTGGFGADELRAAGARTVVPSLRAISTLDAPT
jgi:phosphoglycolate phosphatase-like HAD superfamily hydrolase